MQNESVLSQTWQVIDSFCTKFYGLEGQEGRM